MKEWAIIVDIDGTLANIDHRRKFVENKPKDWNNFRKGILNDTLNTWCARIIQQMKTRYEIILCSGRMEDERIDTEKWLKDNDVRYSKLLMRKLGDYRNDSIIKAEIYENEIEPKYNVIFVIDDRKRVVDMWREKGLVCLQCAEGNF